MRVIYKCKHLGSVKLAKNIIGKYLKNWSLSLATYHILSTTIASLGSFQFMKT